MELPSEAALLRVFIGESDRHDHLPLYEAIVLEARKRGMAGATVLRGVMGFGADSHLHTTKILRLSEDLPIIIEIVDMPERIDEFLPVVDEMMEEGLVTVERIHVKMYRSSHGRPAKP